MGFSRNDCIVLLEVLDERGVGSAADHRLEKDLYGSENDHFAFLQTLGTQHTIPNLEKAPCRNQNSPKQVISSRGVAEACCLGAGRFSVAKIGSCFRTEEKIGDQQENQTMNHHFLQRIEKADPHVERDPSQRKPTRPVVAS